MKKERAHRELESFDFPDESRVREPLLLLIDSGDPELVLENGISVLESFCFVIRSPLSLFQSQYIEVTTLPSSIFIRRSYQQTSYCLISSIKAFETDPPVITF